MNKKKKKIGSPRVKTYVFPSIVSSRLLCSPLRASPLGLVVPVFRLEHSCVFSSSDPFGRCHYAITSVSLRNIAGAVQVHPPRGSEVCRARNVRQVIFRGRKPLAQHTGCRSCYGKYTPTIGSCWCHCANHISRRVESRFVRLRSNAGRGRVLSDVSGRHSM